MNILQTTVLGFTLLTLISWLVLGFLAGLVVHAIDPGDVRGGFFGTTLLGILGAIAGGFLSNLFFGVSYSGLNIRGFITAIVGSLILALLSRLFFRKNEHIKTQTRHIE